GHQVERPRPEPVLRAGQRAHRADLDGVAGEVGLERGSRAGLTADQVRGLRRPDLLLRPALHQVDERVTRDLRREPGAPLAQHAPLAVQQYLRRDRQRLRERPFAVDEPRLRSAVSHRLVLQWTLTALAADRTIQLLVAEQ